MGKKALLVALLLLISPLTKAEALDLQGPGMAPPDKLGLQDGSREDACACCQKCKAAQRTIKPKEEEGPAKKTDACNECCQQCGSVAPPAPDQTPPEIIDNRMPPEIKGRGTVPDIIDKEPK